jgi:hypothetical protein
MMQIDRNHLIQNVWLNKTSCSKNIFNENLRLFSLSEGNYIYNGMTETAFDFKSGCDGIEDQFCTSEQHLRLPHDYDLVGMTIKTEMGEIEE